MRFGTACSFFIVSIFNLLSFLRSFLCMVDSVLFFDLIDLGMPYVKQDFFLNCFSFWVAFLYGATLSTVLENII